MKIWADHQFKSTGEEIIKCPLCRSEFGAYKVFFSKIYTSCFLYLLFAIKNRYDIKISQMVTHPLIACSKLRIETLERGVKYVQS